MARSTKGGPARSAAPIEIVISTRDCGVCRSEAELLDDLDRFGSARDTELAVDRRDVRLYGRTSEVEPIGDLLEREVCWKLRTRSSPDVSR